MKLLFFEYSTIYPDSSLLSEGFNMLKSVLNDLDNQSFFEITYLINPNINIKTKNCKKISISADLITWLDKHSDNYDICLFIAPEDDLIQYKITKTLENHNIIIIGSNSYATYTCTSKILTYKNTPEKILKIPTQIIYFDKINYEKIKEILQENVCIIKPDDKTSSELIFIIKNLNEFKKIINIYKKHSIKKCLLQKYIPGKSYSVSLIKNKKSIKCLTVNSQDIIKNNSQLKYNGCITPLNHPLKNELFSISQEIVNNIDGLLGFIGIDFIIYKNKIFFVEINSRLTTPYVVLQEICEDNLTLTLINSVINNQTRNIKFKHKKKFLLNDMGGE